jgi:serine/threonine protein kinase
MAQPSEPGVVFGRYRLVEQLGSGGMARVFRAVIDGPKGFAHELVIKRIRPEYSSNAHFVNMLAREARICGLLRHHSIVQVHEFAEVDGEYYLAMEMVEGYDLLAVARALTKAERTTPAGVACHIINELAGALGYAHALVDNDGQSLGVVHRDVSPSNVMLGKLGTVKLLDFGIAKAAATAREEQTSTGTLKGKIGYMSPEQAEGLPLDGRSDLFALGVVFHEMLTQRRLFRADGDMERLRMVREAKVDPPSTIVSGIAPEVDAVVMKMLARRREDRYQRAEDIVADLTPLCSHAGALRALVSELSPHFALRTGALLGPEDARYLPNSLSVGQLQPLPQTRPDGAVQSTMSGAGSRGELLPKSDYRIAATPGAWRRWGLPALVGAAFIVIGGWLVGGFWHANPGAATAPGAATTNAPAPVAPLPAGAARSLAATATAANGELPSPPTPVPTLPSPAIAAATPTPTPAAAGTGGVRAEQVHLSLTGPDGAEVFVDGLLVGQVPLNVALAPIARERHVLVRQPGFAPWTRKVAGDTTIALTAHLSRRHGASAPGGDSADEARIYDPFAR